MPYLITKIVPADHVETRARFRNALVYKETRYEVSTVSAMNVLIYVIWAYLMMPHHWPRNQWRVRICPNSCGHCVVTSS